MKITDFCFVACLIIGANGYTSSGPFTKEPAIWSLRCLYAGSEKCFRALTEYELPEAENLTFPELEHIFRETDKDVKNLIIKQDLAGLTRVQACKIPKPFLLLLSAEHLKSVRSEVLGWMLGCNTDDLAIVRLIAESVQFHKEPYNFYTEIQSMKLGENVLSILAEFVKSINYTNSAQWFVSEAYSILEQVDPDIILSDNYRVLHFMRNINPDIWVQRSQKVKRIWAYALGRYVRNMAAWGDMELQTWGHLLTGSTMDELGGLNAERIQNKTKFFQLPFSLLQVRGLFGHFYRHHVVIKLAVYRDVKPLLHQLLPRHIRQFDDDFAELPQDAIIKGQTTLSTSLQIAEFIARMEGDKSAEELISKKEGLIKLNQLSYSLPLDAFKKLNYTLSYRDQILQNERLSLGQLFYLTDGGSAYKLSMDGIQDARGVLRGLPTNILNSGLPPSIHAHLAAEMSASTPPRSAALLDHLLLRSVSDKNVRSLLKNSDANVYLNFLPSKFVETHHETILPVLEHYVKQHPKFANEIPEHLLSVILRKSGNRALQWEAFEWNNESSIFPILLRGLTCADIRQISPLEFIHVISRFNTLRSTHGWIFPKHLQLCSLRKFVEYLDTKSSFMTQYLSSSLLSLMTSSDVEAVGGFVLTRMPLLDVRMSPHRDLIFTSIGRLSLSELLISAPMHRLLDIAELNYRPKIGKDLFNLGNLTAFLSASNIVGMDPADFKLMLEAGYLDKRVCATDIQRDAWASLISDAFGSADKWKVQDLVTLGDLLLVIPHHDLAQVDVQVWAEAADLIANTGYTEMIEWFDGPLPFFNVCEKLLVDQYEATIYRRELNEYVGWLLTAAQYQMDTVVNATGIKLGLHRYPHIRVGDSVDEIDDPSTAETGHFWSILPLPSFRDKRQGSLLSKLTCNAIRVVGKPAELFMTAATIDEMGTEEVENCKEEFGKMDLPKDVGMHIWNKINKAEAVHLGGKLLAHAGPVDVSKWNLSLDEKWSLETIYYLSTYNQLSDTKSAILNLLSRQKLALLSVEQLVALGPYACDLTDARLMANVFFKASRHLGASLPCDYRCLNYFVPFLENEVAYGPMPLWTAEDVESMGILIAGLPTGSWISLVNENPQALARMGSRALKCLPAVHLQALTEDAIRELPATTATVLLREYAFALNASTKEYLEDYLYSVPNLRTPETDQIEYVWENFHYVPRIKEKSAASCVSYAILTQFLVVLTVLVY